MLGDSAVCEHVGIYQSSELSRFRHSKRKTRCCPLCGHRNPITSEKYCEKLLYLVEYLHVQPVDEDMPLPQPTPSGHGASGPGGHYVGRCLCSPIGCPMGVPCNGFVNPLFGYHIGINMINPNFAIVTEDHVVNWQPGVQLTVGQTVFVSQADRWVEPQDAAPKNKNNNPNILWRDGRMGGQAVIRAWRKCGGNNLTVSWHGPKPLQNIPWEVEEEDTLIMLLQEDGSTGLDLSFATHIFLLERIADPALRNQIISRAHRVGATGPVQVQLLQVVAEDIPQNKLAAPHMVIDLVTEREGTEGGGDEEFYEGRYFHAEN
jgi:hypothetical protein